MQRAAVYRYGNDSPFGASPSTGLRQALRLQLEVTLKYHCIIAGSSSTEFTLSTSVSSVQAPRMCSAMTSSTLHLRLSRLTIGGGF